VRRAWTTAEDETLRRLYPNTRTAEIAQRLGRNLSGVYQRAYVLDLHKSAEFFASPAAGRTNGRQGLGTRFGKGHVPANKGLRRPCWGPGRMKETQFRKGVRMGIAAKNWRPVGTILPDADGYLRIKVREAQPGERYGFGNVRVWPLMQRHVWEQVHGPIPPGHNVCFKDGDRSNCAIDNLELVSRADLMRRNSYHNYPAPIPEVIQLIGALNRKIRRRGDGNKEQDQRSA
jgi:hypothetical protein